MRAGWTDRQRDGRTEWNQKTQQLLCCTIINWITSIHTSLSNMALIFQGVHDVGILNGLWSGSSLKLFRWVNLKLILVIDGSGISCDTALRWLSLDLNADKATLVWVLTWCHQTTSHYLSQCWASSIAPLGQNELIFLTHWLIKSAITDWFQNH